MKSFVGGGAFARLRRARSAKRLRALALQLLELCAFRLLESMRARLRSQSGCVIQINSVQFSCASVQFSSVARQFISVQNSLCSGDFESLMTGETANKVYSYIFISEYHLSSVPSASRTFRGCAPSRLAPYAGVRCARAYGSPARSEQRHVRIFEFKFKRRQIVIQLKEQNWRLASKKETKAHESRELLQLTCVRICQPLVLRLGFVAHVLLRFSVRIFVVKVASYLYKIYILLMKSRGQISTRTYSTQLVEKIDKIKTVTKY